jgi:hypothetical protein
LFFWLGMGFKTSRLQSGGVFRDLEQLIMAIGRCIDGHSQNPKPFIWSAKATDILEMVTRARAVLNKLPPVWRTTLDNHCGGCSLGYVRCTQRAFNQLEANRHHDTWYAIWRCWE